MNPGVAEEAGQTARSVISSLAAQPALLFLLVFNIMFVAVVAWLMVQGRSFAHDETKALQDIVMACAKDGHQ